MACTALCMPSFAKKKAKADLWPDGTVISEWFNDNDTVNVASLGKKYKVTDYGVVNDGRLHTKELQGLIDKAAAEQQWLLISEDEISKYRSAAIATGIGCIKVNETTAEGKTVTGIYNAGAVKTEKTQSGLNIIKYSVGTSKKIFVK